MGRRRSDYTILEENGVKERLCVKEEKELDVSFLGGKALVEKVRLNIQKRGEVIAGENP